jgi:hypothetical protein
MRLAWARTGSPVLIAGIAALMLVPMLFALVFASRGILSGDPVEFLANRYDQLVGGLATPLIALLLGTSAFCAEMGSPSEVITAACSIPTRRGRRCVPPAPGNRPSLTSGTPSFAEGTAMR